MTIIHMETEQVQEVARRLRQQIGDMDGAIISLRRAKERLAMAWSGESAVAFETELQEWIARCTRQSIALTDLLRRLGAELEEWQQADASLSMQGMETVELRLTEVHAQWHTFFLPMYVRVVKGDQDLLRSRLPQTNRQNRLITVRPLSQLPREARPPTAQTGVRKKVVDPALAELNFLMPESQMNPMELYLRRNEGYIAKDRLLQQFTESGVVTGGTATAAEVTAGMAAAQTEARRRQSFLQTDQGRRLFGSLDPRLRDQIPASYFSEGTRGVSVGENGRVVIEYTTYAGRGRNRSPVGSRQAVLNLIPPAAFSSLPQGENIPGFGEAEGLIARPLDISSNWTPAVQTQRLQVQQTQQVIGNITRMMHDMQASVMRKIG